MTDMRVGILGPNDGPDGGGTDGSDLGPIAKYLLNRLLSSDIEPQDALNIIRAAREIRNNVNVFEHKISETIVTALVGKVQSGKTTGIALATSVLADAGVDCFIVLTGTKKTLTEQTSESLEDMFGHFQDHPDWFWHFVNSAGSVDETLHLLKTHFQSRSGGLRRVLLVVTMMKEDDYLDSLVKVLVRLNAEDIDISGRFVVFDDEADQGSPNRAVTSAQRPSSLNDLIGKVRNHLGVHSFIPVTATPQALLLDLPDGFVRPDKVVLLSPGSKYVGGDELFREYLQSYARTVMPPDLVAINSRSLEPPLGLLDAIATFLLTAQLIQKTGNRPSPISMLIHPHKEKNYHVHVVQWLNNILRSWHESVLLSSNITEEVCYKIFKNAARDLASTDRTNRLETAGYSISDSGLERWIRDACEPIQSPLLGVRKISGNDSFSYREWGSKAMWILVGGDVLGRGFVVKGLTTTYMTRDVRPNAAYNMDTLQQRARFFGYKGEYLDVLRGWFPPSLSEKFQDYVLHEDVMWLFLDKQMKQGRSLREARTIFLESEFGRSTRTSANRGRARSKAIPTGWYKQHFLFNSDLSKNLLIFNAFKSKVNDFEWWHPPKFSTPGVEFLSVICKLDSAVELLDKWVAESVDFPVVHAVADYLSRKDPNMRVRIIDMSSKRTARGSSSETRERSVSNRINEIYKNDPWGYSDFAQINNLFTGSIGQKDQDCYDADSYLTIQVHNVRPKALYGVSDVQVGALAIHFEDPLLKRVLGERNDS